MTQTAKYFKIHELVPEKVYHERGEKAWALLDPRLITLIDAMRERYGRATINSYAWGGDRQWSGLRTSDSPYYRPYSQHSFGRAVDILFNDISAEEVRQDMLKNPSDWVDDLIPSITLEDSVSWVHVDVRNAGQGINLFKP